MFELIFAQTSHGGKIQQYVNNFRLLQNIQLLNYVQEKQVNQIHINQASSTQHILFEPGSHYTAEMESFENTADPILT